MEVKDFRVVKVDDLKEDIKKADYKDPVFTKDEAQQVMDIMIEDSCMWRLYKFYPEKYKEMSTVMEQPVMYSGSVASTDAVVETPTDEDLEEIADKIYRNIVETWRYNAVTLQICRKSDFSYESVLEKVKECNDEMAAEKENMGKALIRSLQRVKERG
ncbi:MAG: hypothetical protein Q8K85_09710, partial [Hyphomicrobium sp.]|nr:hypothetical protein [Hyphomicrobium sp.]